MIGYFLAFVSGTFVGSFINVCVYRLPIGGSIVWPPSHCTVCGEPIKWYDNIPLVSYLVLRGQCRVCLSPFSVRYFIVELATGCVFLVAWLKTCRGELSTAQFWAFLPLLCAFLASTITDLERFIIPDEISVTGMVVGMLLSVILPEIQPRGDIFMSYLAPRIEGEHVAGLVRSGVGVVIGAGVVEIVGVAGRTILRKEAMGFGDVKFMGMVGAFLGPTRAAAILPLASVIGAVVGLAILVTRRSHRIPFAPYLSAAGFAVVLFEKDLVFAFDRFQSFMAGAVGR